MHWLPNIQWNSIHAKLLATYLLLVTLGTSLMSGYVLWSFYAYFMQARQADLKNSADALIESTADALEVKNFQRVQVIAQRYGAPENITVRVFDPQGSLIATSAPQTDQQILNWLEIPGVQEALRGHSAQGIAKGISSNDDRLYIIKPIVRNSQMLGVLRLSITLEQFQYQFAKIIWTILVTLGVTILLCAFISDRFARSLSQPIERMRSFAMRVGSGHFDDRLAISQSNELDQLATDLNRMSERLASLDEERRAFLAKVSHELRTPVSNVLVTVEALEGGAVEEIELRDRFFQTIKDETRRLSTLIHDLLDLGRLEAGVTQLEQQTISLTGLINRAVRAMEPQMQSKRLKARLEVANLKFTGDPERLLQALLNVLDNAIKHSQPDSEVLIAGYREKHSVVIQIRDQGAGISQNDLPRIFEQFYTTRSSGKEGGTGLGLAIAKRIVEAQGGTIAASSKLGEGAVFIILLPL
ncbi:HAMP domain-containing histidine kinase [Phormidium tenue FACHB-886]|nr:HAMP domain-containing histidine kinase [Phormidium tenue FACHB-886]